jgi:hypothetical protein
LGSSFFAGNIQNNFNVKKKLMKVLGQYKVFCFISKLTLPSRKMSKITDGIFFYFFSFANFFHFIDENLACEHELNNFFYH